MCETLGARMFKSFAAATLLMSMLVTAAHAAEPAGEFMISFWCGPPDEFVTLERFQQIKDAHFTHVFPPCNGGGVEANKKRLEFAAKVGLKVFVSDARIPVSLGGDEKVKAA